MRNAPFPALEAHSLASRRVAARPDVLLFSGAIGVVAFHAMIDTFIAPESGTDSGDHLLPGIGVLSVLLAAVIVHPRLPAGGRAAMAATLGVLCLEGGALAVADARGGGARSEDWTGFALLPIGIALLGVSATLLWRSRKPTGHRYPRRAAMAVGAVLVAYWVIVPAVIGVLATHRPRTEIHRADLGRPYSEVAIETSDGLALAAWYVPSRNGGAVVAYPTRQGTKDLARMLVRHGYGVLLLDARGYDGSEGAANVFGWEGVKDVDAAVTWLRNRPDVTEGRIGGVGLSVGGEVMLQAAASNPDLRAVVSDGAGVRSVHEHLLRGWRGWFSLPEAAMQTAAVAVLSGSRPPPSLADVVERISPRPVLFVYAGRGGGGEELNPLFYRAAVAPKSLWRIDEAGHLGGLAARPREYERRLTRFLDRALLEEG